MLALALLGCHQYIVTLWLAANNMCDK